MIDKDEQRRKGGAVKPKHSKTHPYAAIEHRVIDSPAFADLMQSSVRVLLCMTRQLTKENNGKLQATFAYMSRRGIGSQHTLQSAIADLIEHGLIYRTKSHGANKQWATYAVTWLPIKNTHGLYLDGWVKDAWRDWQPK